MTPLSLNAQAILLLTAPLIVGPGAAPVKLLSPSEYGRLARHLRDVQRQPADLLGSDLASLLDDCQPGFDLARLNQLLGRGFLLTQAIERWHSRAIWVISRADPDYPRRLKARLREDAPALLYGCGEMRLMETGGLAVVGSRDIDETLVDYTAALGRLASHAGKTIVSGGAKGVDQAAMRSALDSGGKAVGVLADSLEKAAMSRENRSALVEGRLVLVSPYDPSVGFNVGHAMQRNKLIYALADASLVVNSDLNKGGTWAGAAEQLDRFNFVPVYVRSTGRASAALEALRSKGALNWPNPADAEELNSVLDAQVPTRVAETPLSSLFADDDVLDGTDEVPDGSAPDSAGECGPMQPLAEETGSLEPAKALFDVVRGLIPMVLETPMKEAEVAIALNISTAQAKAWLQRLVEEGALEKQKKPVRYVVKQLRLFDE
jgi:DNA processing protein